MAYLIVAGNGFKLTSMPLIPSEVEVFGNIISGCSAGFLDYASLRSE
jgi:hypothetical protein